MKFGLEPHVWNYLQINLFGPLKAQSASIYVYGSRARGDHKQFSDLDILIEREPQLPVSTLASYKALLEDSNLPIKVDLVQLHELPASFLPAILAERIAI